MHFDSSINLSTLAAVGALIVTLLGLHRQNTKVLTLIQHRISMMWNWYKKEHGIIEDKDYED